MTYTVLAVAYFLVCATIGLLRPQNATSTRLAAGLAFGMVFAQFMLLSTQ